MNRACLLIAAAILAGCASTQEAATSLTSSFTGKNLDAFVLRYGPPFQRHQLNSGDVLFRWSSEVRNYGLPTTTTVQGTVSPGGFSGTAITTGGGSVNVFCEVEIVATQDGQIKSIAPVRDTIGRWTTSRCAEIFKQ